MKKISLIILFVLVSSCKVKIENAENNEAGGVSQIDTSAAGFCSQAGSENISEPEDDSFDIVGFVLQDIQ